MKIKLKDNFLFWDQKLFFFLIKKTEITNVFFLFFNKKLSCQSLINQFQEKKCRKQNNII